MRGEEKRRLAVTAWSRWHPYDTCWILLSFHLPTLMGSYLYWHVGSLLLTDDLSVAALHDVNSPTKVKKPSTMPPEMQSSHAQVVLHNWVCSEKHWLLDLPALVTCPLRGDHGANVESDNVTLSCSTNLSFIMSYICHPSSKRTRSNDCPIPSKRTESVSTNNNIFGSPALSHDPPQQSHDIPISISHSITSHPPKIFPWYPGVKHLHRSGKPILSHSENNLRP